MEHILSAVTVTRQEIFSIIQEQILQVLPSLSEKNITSTHSLKLLGADSIDRADIIIQSMASLGLKIPLIELTQAQNIEGLVEIFYQKLHLQ